MSPNPSQDPFWVRVNWALWAGVAIVLFGTLFWAARGTDGHAQVVRGVVTLFVNGSVAILLLHHADKRLNKQLAADRKKQALDIQNERELKREEVQREKLALWQNACEEAVEAKLEDGPRPVSMTRRETPEPESRKRFKKARSAVAKAKATLLIYETDEAMSELIESATRWVYVACNVPSTDSMHPEGRVNPSMRPAHPFAVREMKKQQAKRHADETGPPDLVHVQIHDMALHAVNGVIAERLRRWRSQ